MSSPDPHNLTRFLDAQAPTYAQALAELQAGHKRSHWMWFIFPQLAGLGHSSTAQFYAIESLDEARAYLAHPTLGPRLIECAEALLHHEGKSATQILGTPDDLKLRSSATLFAQLTPADSVFAQLLKKYYNNQPDPKTLELLQSS
jgi:uncharacterized protein (DUF1810 family)